MSLHEELRTLVLNNNCLPINLFPLSIIPVESAITRVFNETCVSIFDYDKPIGTGTRMNQRQYFWPSVIARNNSNYLHRDKVSPNADTLFYRDNGRCAYCQEILVKEEITIDHVVPSSKGGSNDWDNITCCCTACNSEKGELMPKGQWAPKNRLYKPTYWDILNNRKKFPLIVYDERWINFLPKWEAPIYLKGGGQING